MNAVQTLMIERLTVSGFRHFAQQQSWQFGGVTAVTGHNYQGKSTLADAIAFVLTGAPYFGGRELDRLQNESQPVLAAELAVLVDGGKRHILRRTRQDGKTAVFVDGTKTTQERFAARFGSRDLILSLLNPLYFAEALGADGRRLLEEYLPAVPHEKVMDGLSENLRAALGGDCLATPEAYLKNRRDELKALQKERLVLQGQLEQTQLTASKVRAALDGKNALLAHTAAALQNLQKKQDGQDFSALDAEIARLSRQYDAARGAGDTGGERLRLEAAARALLGQRYVPADGGARLRGMQDWLQQQYARHHDEQARLSMLEQRGACPLCGQPVAPDRLPAIRQAVAARLEKIQQQGVKVRQQAEALAVLEEQAQRQFEERRAHELSRLQAGLQAVPPGQTAEQRRGSIKAEIKALSAKRLFAGLTDEEAAQYQALSQEQQRLESEAGQLKQVLDSLPKGQETALAEIDAEIRAVSDKIEAAKDYLSKRTALLFAGVTLPKTGFRLYEPVKETGEMRDVFKLIYDGRDFVQLSLSERVRCGLEVVSLLSRLSGRRYPLFVDNAESLCDLGPARPAGQLILSRAVKGQTLQVRAMDETARKAG